MLLDLLHELGEKHGIFAAGDTDGDPVSVLDQLVVPDGFGERPPDGFAEFFDKGPFNFFCTLSHRSF